MCSSVHLAVTKRNNKNLYSTLENLPGNIEIFQTSSKLDIILFCNLTRLTITFFLPFCTYTLK